jgi:RloB-like protein
MGKDNTPRVRQAKDLARKKGSRATYDRILIVCEGSKTEPNYFKEIKQFYRLHTANVEIQHSALGTCPLQVVKSAEELFLNGNSGKSIQKLAFEKVYAVFDRDDHKEYFNARKKAVALNGKLKNDLNKKVEFKAISSVPCFELWLLLHFEDVQIPLHRDVALARLKIYLPDYTKGKTGTYEATKDQRFIAAERAEKLPEHNGNDCFTEIHELMTLLTTLR